MSFFFASSGLFSESGFPGVAVVDGVVPVVDWVAFSLSASAPLGDSFSFGFV